MGEEVRWNLKVSKQTNDAVRAVMAERGQKDGDLSRFVEGLIARELFRETLREVHERNADADPEEIEQIVDEAVRSARQELREKRQRYFR